MADVSVMTAEVARAKTVDESAAALINGFQTRLDEAIAAAVAANDDADLSALTALSDDLKASSDALQAAVSANTPSA